MLPLQFTNGHVFIELDHRLWLLDTGAPASFGSAAQLELGGETFQLSDNFPGLTMEMLAGFVRTDCAGLLGSDILGQFDWILDCAQNTAECSPAELAFSGHQLPVDDCMGIPVLSATIAGKQYEMFFDTGAQLSYFSAEVLDGYPPAGEVTDFYPGLGEFTTATCFVDVSLGPIAVRLRCGILPEAIQGLIGTVGNVTGIIGNEMMQQRRIGYFPRRGIVVVR